MHELDTLYDKEFIDSLPNFVRGRSNPFVVAIFKSPDEDVREIPNQIEAWYAELPANIRKDFYSRLRDKSKKSINFVSALAELYVHHWILKDLQASSIEYEPPVGEGNPDFRVSLPDGNKVICEVYSAQDIGEDPPIDEISEEFFGQCVRWLPKGYTLWVDPLKKVKDKEAVTELVRSLRLKLEGNDFQAGSEFELGSEEDTFHVKVKVLPKKDTDSRTDINGWTEVFYLTPTIEHVQERLQEKARKFSEALEVPFLMIAIDETGNLMSENDWLDVCYGKECYVVEVDESTGEIVNGRMLPREGGLFTRLRDSKEHRASYISAVIAGRRKINAEGLYFDLQCYKNPFADYPIPEFFDDLMSVWKPDPDQPGRLIKIEKP